MGQVCGGGKKMIFWPEYMSWMFRMSFDGINGSWNKFICGVKFVAGRLLRKSTVFWDGNLTGASIIQWCDDDESDLFLHRGSLSVEILHDATEAFVWGWLYKTT